MMALVKYKRNTQYVTTILMVLKTNEKITAVFEKDAHQNPTEWHTYSAHAQSDNCCTEQ